MARKIDISIILPVYNETARLVSGLNAIVEYLEKREKERRKKKKTGTKTIAKKVSQQHFTWEIIMVDDGSNVPASEVINHSYLQKTIFLLTKNKKFRGYRLDMNYGKGHAIAAGVRMAKGDNIVFMDIDGSVPVQILPQIMLGLKEADIAIGSRRIPESVIAVHQPMVRETGGRIYTLLSQSLFGLHIHDATCGFKGFRREVAKDLFPRMKINRWAFDTEILALAVKRHYTIREVPVVWSDKKGSKVKLNDTIGSFFDLLRVMYYMSTDIYEKEKSKGEKEKRKDMICDACGEGDFRFLFDHHHNWKVQQCTTCGLVQVIPRPSRKEVAALYHDDEAHFDPYIEQQGVHRIYFRNKLSSIYKLLNTSTENNTNDKKIKLLDVGCLTGVLLDEAWKMGIRAEGLDISADAVNYCRQKGLTAYQGTLDVFLKKNPRKKYTVVTAFEIIEHEYSPKSLIQAMYKAVPNGGLAVVSTPNHGSWWRSLMGKRWPGYTHPEHLYFFDPHSLEYLFREVGFSEVTIKSGDSRPFPLWFLFKRGADYFPAFAPLLKFMAAATRLLPIQNPINPWDDLLVIARK